MANRTRAELSPRTVWTLGLHVMALLVLWGALQQLGPVFALLSISGLLALALDPLVRWLQGRGLKRGLGVALVSVGVLAAVGLAAATILPMLLQQVLSLVGALPDLVQRLQHWSWVEWAEARFDLQGALEQQAGRLSGGAAELLVDVLTGVVGLVFTGLTVFILTLFMLLSGGGLYRQALDWVRPRRRARVHRLLRRMRQAVGGYLAGSAVIVTIGGAVTAAVSLALGVPYFLALGLSYVMLGFIPYAGSFFVAVLVSLTTLATVGPKRAVIALALFMVYQQVEGNLLQPLVQRHTIKMNPLLISVVVLVGGATLGILGAVIALPVAAALQVLLEDVHRQRQAEWAAAHPATEALRQRQASGGGGLAEGDGAGAGGEGAGSEGGVSPRMRRLRERLLHPARALPRAPRPPHGRTEGGAWDEEERDAPARRGRDEGRPLDGGPPPADGHA
jgi:predicted PurR-regulated permease PerM